MKSFLTISVAAATMTLGLMAQKLETQKPDPTKVLRVETAKDHLTVIELSDAVTMVAVGNRSAFTVERRENKVFVTPTDEGARTNLFIWTSGGRYAYELVPAADIDQMHFAIDQVATAVTSSIPAPPTAEVAPRLPVEMLTEAMPVLRDGRAGNERTRGGDGARPLSQESPALPAIRGGQPFGRRVRTQPPGCLVSGRHPRSAVPHSGWRTPARRKARAKR